MCPLSDRLGVGVSHFRDSERVLSFVSTKSPNVQGGEHVSFGLILTCLRALFRAEMLAREPAKEEKPPNSQKAKVKIWVEVS